MSLSLEETIRNRETAQAAFNILHKAFYQSDSLINFDIKNPNRIVVEDLLLSIVTYPPVDASKLVFDMLSCEELHIRFRVEAMIYYVDFCKEIPKQRQHLINELFSDTRQRDYYGNKHWSKSKLNDFSNLTKRNLVNLEELLFATQNFWAYQACNAISHWENRNEFRQLIVQGIIESLRVIFDKFMALKGGWFNTYQIKLLVEIFSTFELNNNEKSVLDRFFQLGVQHFQANFADRFHRITELNGCRRQLGLLDDTQERYRQDALEVMENHWQQESITSSSISQQLIQARLIPNKAYFEKFGVKDLNLSSGDFLSLLYGDGSKEYSFCLFSIDYDDGYSDEAFYKLIGMLQNPSIEIHKISKADEFRFPFIDLSDITDIWDDFDDTSHYQDTYYFEYQKQNYLFKLSYLNVEEQIYASVYTFNNFLKQLGRVERCYEIDIDGGDCLRGFFVADRFKYSEMQQYLRLPSWAVD